MNTFFQKANLSCHGITISRYLILNAHQYVPRSGVSNEPEIGVVQDRILNTIQNVEYFIPSMLNK